MSRMMLSPFAYVCAIAFFALTLNACSDDVVDYSLCIDVECGDNAFCVADTGECECNEGFEPEEGACTPIEEDTTCQSDADCDDGLFCNGEETCNQDTKQCDAGQSPQCQGSSECNEDYLGECMASCLAVHTTVWGGTGDIAIFDAGAARDFDFENDDSSVLLKDGVYPHYDDAAISFTGGALYLMERHVDAWAGFKDNLRKLDIHNDYQELWSFNLNYLEEDYDWLGMGGDPQANPYQAIHWHDEDSGEDYLYLALYNYGRILRVNANPTPGDDTSFFGEEITDATIVGPAWDGFKTELTAIYIEDDIIFGLTQGLDDYWGCGTDDNKSRFYAYHLPNLEPANVFDNGEKNYLELNFCNAFTSAVMPNGDMIVQSTAGYGFGSPDGLEIVNLKERTHIAAIADNTTLENGKYFTAVERVADHYFIVDEFLGRLREITPADPVTDPWTEVSPPLLGSASGIMDIVGHEDILYVADFGYGLQRVDPSDLDNPAIFPTNLSAESIEPFYVQRDSCW